MKLTCFKGILSAWLISHIVLNAQLPKCGNPPVMENDCADACVVCDLDGISSQNGHTVPGNAPPGYCTAVVHSIRYLAFVAGSTSLSFSVTVNSCSLGNSIELGVYESPDCSSFNLVSNCNTAMPRGGTFQFVTTKPLKIGCHYYIVIDGNGPANCTYTVRVTAGSAKAPIPTIGNIDGPKKFCVGEIVDYTLSNYSGACDYEWSAVNGSIISSSDTRVSVEWNIKGKGRLCFEAKNACHSSNKCIDVEIGDASPPEIINAQICENGSFVFKGTSYGEGDYEIHLKNHFGCDSTIELHIESLPENRSTKDSIICYPDCLEYNGNKYCTEGNYLLINKSKIKPFCDSLIELNLGVLKVDAKILQLGKISCSNTKVILHSDSSIVIGKGRIQRRWYSPGNKLIDTLKQIQVDSAGKYKLVITLFHANGKKCESITEYEVIGNAKPPELEPIQSIRICEGNYFFTKDAVLIDKNLTGSSYKYYKSYPLDSQNLIIDSILIHNNTKIYVLADNQGCSDTLGIDLNLIPSIKTSIISPTYCKGDMIDYSDIEVKHNISIDYQSEFFLCPELDSNCKVSFPLSADKSFDIYFKTINNGCERLLSHNIVVKSKPTLVVSSPKKVYCNTEAVNLFFNNLQSDEQRILVLNQKDTFVADSNRITLNKLVSGKYTFELITKNTYCSDRIQDQFEVASPDLIPEIKCYSNDSSITFSWKGGNMRNKLSYTTNRPDKISQATNDSVVFNKLDPGSKVKFKLVLIDSICGDQELETECEAVHCPNVILNITGKDSFCLDQSGNLRINFSANIDKPQAFYNGRWFGQGLIDSINGIYEFNTSVPGKIRIGYIYYKGTCRHIEYKDIWLRKPPVALFQINDKVCQDSIILLKYTGQDTLDDQNQWQFNNAFISQNNNDKEIFLKWNQAGKQKIKLNVKNRLCEDQFEKEIDVIPNPEVANIECISQDSNIVFRWKKGRHTDKIFSEIVSGLNSKKINDSTLLVDNLIPGQKVVLRLTSKGNQPCGNIVNTLECETKKCPDIKLLSQDTVRRCLSSSNSLLNLNSFLQDTALKIDWDHKNIINNRINNLADLGIGEHCIFLNSQLEFCKYRDTLCLIIGEIPEVNFSIKDKFCPGDEEKGKLSLNKIIKGGLPLQFLWDNKIWDGTDKIYLDEGKYSIKLIDNYGCELDTSIFITQTSAIMLDIGPDLEIEKGKLIQLKSDIRGIIQSIRWDPSDHLTCSACPNPVSNADNTTEYIATIIDSNGCIDTDTLILRIRDNRIFVPNVFSPNGDGINDFFTIYGSSDVKEIMYLNIYDRWGELVFSKTNFPHSQENEGWDGTFGGQKLNPGVYVYSAEVRLLNKKIEKIIGELTLLK